jgi:hypothetical protein
MVTGAVARNGDDDVPARGGVGQGHQPVHGDDGHDPDSVPGSARAAGPAQGAAHHGPQRGHHHGVVRGGAPRRGVLLLGVPAQVLAVPRDGAHAGPRVPPQRRAAPVLIRGAQGRDQGFLGRGRQGRVWDHVPRRAAQPARRGCEVAARRRRR